MNKSIDGLIKFLHKKMHEECVKYGGNSTRSVELHMLYRNVDALLSLIKEYKESGSN